MSASRTSNSPIKQIRKQSIALRIRYHTKQADPGIEEWRQHMYIRQHLLNQERTIERGAWAQQSRKQGLDHERRSRAPGDELVHFHATADERRLEKRGVYRAGRSRHAARVELHASRCLFGGRPAAVVIYSQRSSCRSILFIADRILRSLNATSGKHE